MQYAMGESRVTYVIEALAIALGQPILELCDLPARKTHSQPLRRKQQPELHGNLADLVG